jgi:hypothetical protein
MAHVDPLDRADVSEFEDYFAYLDGHAGYVPNAFLTMARLPGLFRGYLSFSAALAELHGVSGEMKVLMSHIASSAYGCRFCEAHTAHTGVKRGVADERIEKVWEFESSELFDDSERAALRLARDMVRCRTRSRNSTSTTCACGSPTSRSSRWSPPCRSSDSGTAGTTPWPPTSRCPS